MVTDGALSAGVDQVGGSGADELVESVSGPPGDRVPHRIKQGLVGVHPRPQAAAAELRDHPTQNTAHLKDPHMVDATFARPDVTTFVRKVSGAIPPMIRSLPRCLRLGDDRR